MLEAARKLRFLWPTVLLSAALADGGGLTLPSLTWNPQLFPNAARPQVIAETAREEAPAFFPPAHLHATLEKARSPYAVDTEINVYPVAELLRQYPERGPYTVRAQLERLQALTQGKESTRELSAARLPYIYSPGADLDVAGAIQPIRTAQLRGVRYLGVFAQEARRFARDEVRYTFQGLSADGRFYLTVDATFGSSRLPPRAELQGSGYDIAPQLRDNSASERRRFEGAVAAYFAEVRQVLDAHTDAPEVAKLDAFVRSLRLR